MQWLSWQQFWSMDGDGWFVWGSYGVFALVLLVECIALVRTRKAVVTRRLRWRRLQAIEQERKQA